MPIKFAAFIISYERPTEVSRMIEILLAQSFPPQKILIVDNSNSNATKELVNLRRYPYVEYHRVGHNSGPAGAASIGLKQLTDQGYDWIYWGDDNDPPNEPDSFKNIFDILKKVKVSSVQIGVLGEIGGRINKFTGRTLNLQNRELDGIIEVDYIPGNKLMLVNSEVVRKGVLPMEKLFFGFEELGFCLMVKQKGFKVLFDGAALLKSRIKAGNTSASYRWRGVSVGDPEKLWRQYYHILEQVSFVINIRKAVEGKAFI
jgi:GT2 family glycosyltransferase